MVQASARLSNEFILTFDDLNGVDEEEMIAELKRINTKYGEKKGRIIPDRTLAIQYAWENAQAGEWILITGKGPEEYKTMYQLPASSDKETIQYLKTMNQQEKKVLSAFPLKVN